MNERRIEELVERHRDWYTRLHRGHKDLLKRDPSMTLDEAVLVAHRIKGRGRGRPPKTVETPAPEIQIQPEIKSEEIEIPVEEIQPEIQIEIQPEIKLPVDGEDIPVIATEKYTYIPSIDTYIIYVGTMGNVSFGGQLVRDICRAYSTPCGQGLTYNEIARTMKISRVAVRAILTALEKTHDSDPFTPEEMAKGALDTLVESALENKREKFHQKMQSKLWAERERKAEKWDAFDQHVARKIEAAIEERGNNLPRDVAPLAGGEGHLVIPVADLHVGLRASPDRCGQEWGLKFAEYSILSAVKKIIGQALSIGGVHSTTLAILGDYFHVDNWGGSTTGGTPQDMDGTFAEMYTAGAEILVKVVDFLRQYAPVVLVIVPGNHDKALSLTLQREMFAWYRNCRFVGVDQGMSPRKYHVLPGGVGLMMHHGDGLGKGSGAAFAAEAPDAWGETHTRFSLCGHLHGGHEWPEPGLRVVRCPSLAPPSRWEKSKFSGRQQRQMALFLGDTGTEVQISVTA